MTRQGRPLESDRERWQRNFADLLQELRVAQTGVQILFAFLLTLPFSARFTEVNGFQRQLYVISLLAAASAAALIIAPVAFHRALFRQGRKPELVVYAHRMATGGLYLMLVAMVSAVFLITDFMYDRTLAAILSGATGLWFLGFWVLMPMFRRRWEDEDAEDTFAEAQERAASSG